MLERASVVRSSDGRAIRAVGVVQDVSGQKVAEEATLRLAAIVASASDAIVGKTTDGIITSWNAAAERLFGYAQAEVLGHSVFMLVPPELHNVERDLLERVRRGERVEYSTTERLCRDGTRLAVSLAVSPIWDPSGQVVGVSSAAVKSRPSAGFTPSMWKKFAETRMPAIRSASPPVINVGVHDRIAAISAKPRLRARQSTNVA